MLLIYHTFTDQSQILWRHHSPSSGIDARRATARRSGSSFSSSFRPRLTHSLSLRSISADSITHALTHLTSDHLPDLHRKLTAVLTKRCLEHLKHARLINQQYLHTNRPAPREHSAFVPLIFHPFISFQQQNKRYLRERRIREYATAVAEAVTTRYAAVVTDMMVALKRTEESLRRLKQRRGGGQGLGGQAGEGGMSDEDKIRLQVWLDVGRFGVEVSVDEVLFGEGWCGLRRKRRWFT